MEYIIYIPERILENPGNVVSSQVKQISIAL